MPEIETIKIGEHSAKLTKLELNSNGDYVAISTDSAALFDDFVNGYKKIADLSDEIPKNIKKIEEQYKESEGFASDMQMAVAISKENVGFSLEATKIVDSIFGDGTVKKYFRNIYDEVPDFLPDSDCFFEFFEKITPVMEKLFDRKMKESEKLSKKRMAKYQPQDYKKKARK